MLDLFLPRRAERVRVYLLPVNMRSGPDKLRALIEETLGADPDPTSAYLFTNKARDALLVYWLDETGERTLQKRFDKGAVVLPELYAEGLPWATIAPHMVPTLFRA